MRAGRGRKGKRPRAFRRSGFIAMSGKWQDFVNNQVREPISIIRLLVWPIPILVEATRHKAQLRSSVVIYTVL